MTAQSTPAATPPAPTMPGEAVRRLRTETAADHDAVDARYAGYDLPRREDYARFLDAHARALPAVEAALVHAGAGAGIALPEWRTRRTMLADDLTDLGRGMPLPLLFALPGDSAAAWGALYVLEGSRLGGGMLARQVSDDLPKRYLAAVHRPGEWRALLVGLEAAAAAGDTAWTARAVAAARATFALYGRAAEC